MTTDAPDPSTDPQHGGPRPDTIAFLMILGMGLAWGLSFSLAKIVSLSGAHPFAYTWWQTAGSGAIVLAITLFRRVPIPLSRAHIFYYLVCGMVGIAVPNVINLTALAHLPAGLMAVLINTVPLMTYSLAVAFSVETFKPLRFVGVLIGLGGVLLIVLPDTSLPNPDLVGWVLIALGTPLCYAGNNIFVAKFRPAETHALALATGQMLAAGTAITPVVFGGGLFLEIWPPFAPHEWAMMGQMIISAVNYTLVFEVIRRAGPVFFSQTAYVVTLSGIAWAAVIFGEQLSLWVWAAVIAVFAGVYLVNKKSR
ncbi:MAG: DMT family transporter [Alphaproteobacteria bacterium]|nr:DMT family transporter [Alphaproteobacteria bacterium]